MTSYQKLKWKYDILMEHFRNIEQYAFDMKQIKTNEDILREWNGYNPEKTEIIQEMSTSIVQEIDATYRELWRADEAK